jgi:hypothetical protein
MTLFKNTLAALAISALFVCAPIVRADEWNKRTIIKVDEAIQLPTIVLQPGTYVFKLLDSPSDRHIVQVFDEKEQHLITTVLAIPNYRLTPRGKTIFTFWEVPAGETPPVRAWFYPGDLYGQEFAYPKNRATQVAAYSKSAVPTTNAESNADLKTMPITSVNENGQTTDLDKSTYTAKNEPPAPEPAPAPVPVTEPAPAPPPVTEPPAETAAQVPEPAPQELPHTASQLPLIGLGGLLSLTAFFALKRSARRNNS